MSLTADPFHGLRLFEDAVTRMMSEPRTSRPWSPAVDVMENEHELILKADVPDIDPKNVSIEVENQTLTMKGARHFEKDIEGKGGYHRIERSYGNFVRSFTVPSTVDTEKVGAEYKNGVLTVRLPKKEAAKPRQIQISHVGQEAGQGGAKVEANTGEKQLNR